MQNQPGDYHRKNYDCWTTRSSNYLGNFKKNNWKNGRFHELRSGIISQVRGPLLFPGLQLLSPQVPLKMSKRHVNMSCECDVIGVGKSCTHYFITFLNITFFFITFFLHQLFHHYFIDVTHVLNSHFEDRPCSAERWTSFQ